MTEMNLLEKEFCEAIDWRLTVRPRLMIWVSGRVLMIYLWGDQTTGSVLAHYYTSLVRSHPLYRLAPPPPTSPLISTSPPHTSSSMDLDVEPPSRLSALKSEPDPSSSSASSDESPIKASPALIPARMNGGRRFVTASNLPSPVRGASSVASSSMDLRDLSLPNPSSNSGRSSRERSVSNSSARDIGEGGVRASPLGQDMEVGVEGREEGRGIEGGG